MIKDDVVYLKHILDAVSSIEEYTENTTYKKFKETPLVQDAVIRQIEIIGEAVKKISSKLKEKYKTLPWNDIARMRDKLIHGYFGVDLEAVWNNVEKDIPSVKNHQS